MNKFNSFLILFFSLLCLALSGQDRFTIIGSKLDELKTSTPGLSQNVELSVSGASLHEFIRALGTSNNVNVSVDPALNEKIYNNFTNVSVADVFKFLTKKYDLDVNIIGNIITFTPFKAPPLPAILYKPKEIKISYDKERDQISIDAQNDSLSLLVRAITKATNKNIIISSDLSNKTINGFIQNQKFQNSLDLLAFGNDLKVTSTNENTYLFERADKSTKPANPKLPAGNKNPVSVFDFKISDGNITASAGNVPIAEIINAVSSELKLNYYLFSELKGNASLSVENSTVDQFLAHILNGTDYTFKIVDNIYFIGDRKLEGLRETKVVQFQNRSAANTIELIPAEIVKGVEIKAFPDLNSVILSGSMPRITEIETFLREIDRVVPVVAIDVMIMDVNDSKSLSTGIEAGLKPPGTTETTGEVHPGLDLNLSSASLNDIITGINGLGLINLGRVTPNFYFKIKALETQGIVKLNSTPKLAALNGHEAKMTIGKTEYYKEEKSDLVTGLNTQVVVTRSYKSVNADLSITILPIVSGDEQITLKITVKQSTFTPRFEPNAPPGSVTREFQSMIRVKNEEMIMLGGLDENTSSETGRGLPLIQRLPVLKWIFSSRTKAKTKSRLTIFIKPSVLY